MRAHRSGRKAQSFCNLLTAFTICGVPCNLVFAVAQHARIAGVLGYECAACMALIMRAFSSAITLWAANICASRVVSSEKGRTVWR